jgi:hypothetical protein
MKFPLLLKLATIALSSLALITTAEAKPDKGGNGKGGNGKGGGQAQGKPDKDKGKGPDQVQHKGKPDHDRKPGRPEIPAWKDDQRKSIVSYFDTLQQKHKGLPTGLAMNERRGKPLPPGWEKKYVAGRMIEDEDWQSFVPVPNDWFPDLRMEPDTRLYHYGDRVVRVYEPRREILDVILLNLLK